ncbi:MAG: hypothetical protein ACYCW6_05775 [Candidatus Xenobia bacterium]
MSDERPLPLLPVAVVAALLVGRLGSVPTPIGPHLTRVRMQELPEPTPVPAALAPLLDAGWLLADPEAAHARGDSVDIDPEDPMTLTANASVAIEQMHLTARGELLVVAGPYGVLRRDRDCELVAADRLPPGIPSLSDLEGAILPFTFEGQTSRAEPITSLRVETAKEDGSSVLRMHVTSPSGTDLQHGFVKIDKPWTADRLTLISYGQTANLNRLTLHHR